MYICPFDEEGLISPIMSKAHPLKGHGLVIECNALAGTSWIPKCLWRSLQPLIKSIQSFSIVG